MTSIEDLASLIRARCAQAASPGVEALADAVCDTYGDSVLAVLFYGSCLRSGDEEGLVDLYVIVDGYQRAYGQGVRALLNALLPPNVFYLETASDSRTVRAKYAVLSIDDFRRGTSRWFHSYLWGRFCQPVGILKARDEAAVALLCRCLAQAVVTFARRVGPRLRQPFTCADLWRAGLSLSYRAELRPERPERAAQLFEADRNHYERITPTAMGLLPCPVTETTRETGGRYHLSVSPWRSLGNRLGWRVRFVQGKILSVLRLLKAGTTFRGGIDYIQWKIERHSGVRVSLDPQLRKYPYVAVWVLAWRLYRKGAFR